MHQRVIYEYAISTSISYLFRPLSKRPKIGRFQDQLSLNAGQKYCRMLPFNADLKYCRMFQGEHSAILLTCIKLPFASKIFVSNKMSFLSGRYTKVLL